MRFGETDGKCRIPDWKYGTVLHKNFADLYDLRSGLKAR